ncbi:MAG TPA: response regulator [Chloroflexota bacterium]|nr:response regulator [Chloroflexota bacterium]
MPRVLVIEDEKGARHVLGSALSRDGNEVQTVAQLDRAVDVARDFQPEVIVADWLFPEGTVLAVAQELRSTFPSAVMIFMSGLPLNCFEGDAERFDPVAILQ